MLGDHSGPSPCTWGPLVDLLGKAGALGAAYLVVEEV